MDPATRGQTIKRARRRHGYAQSVLAGLVGRSDSWLSQVERGILPVDSHEILSRLGCLGIGRGVLNEGTAENVAGVTSTRSPGAGSGR